MHRTDPRTHRELQYVDLTAPTDAAGKKGHTRPLNTPAIIIGDGYHDYDGAGGDEHDDDEEERHPDGVRRGHHVPGTVIRAP